MICNVLVYSDKRYYLGFKRFSHVHHQVDILVGSFSKTKYYLSAKFSASSVYE